MQTLPQEIPDLMQAELSRSVVPPGGFYYEQGLSDGSWSRIEGGSLEHLLDLILRYRQNNGMILAEGTVPTPEGVANDYHAWACSRWPWLCTGVREPVPQTTEVHGVGPSGFELLVLRMQRWVDNLRRAPIGWVDPKRAIDRAQICVGCPSNVDWTTNCGSCNQNLTMSAAAVRGVRRTGLEAGLKGCRAFGTLQELAVWLEDPQGDRRYAPPPQCWRVRP